MGWLELLAWCKAMRRQKEAQAPDPHSWKVPDPWFAAQHRQERDERGGW